MIRSRSFVVRFAAVACAVAAAPLGLAGCGDDTSKAATSSSTTASTTTSSTQVDGVTSSTAAVDGTTTTGAVAGDNTVLFGISDMVQVVTMQSCHISDDKSIEVKAHAGAGTVLSVKVANGSGSVVWRGSPTDREGTVNAVTIQSDGTFRLAGIISVADDSAQVTEDLTISGRCTE